MGFILMLWQYLMVFLIWLTFFMICVNFFEPMWRFFAVLRRTATPIIEPAAEEPVGLLVKVSRSTRSELDVLDHAHGLLSSAETAYKQSLSFAPGGLRDFLWVPLTLVLAVIGAVAFLLAPEGYGWFGSLLMATAAGFAFGGVDSFLERIPGFYEDAGFLPASESTEIPLRGSLAFEEAIFALREADIEDVQVSDKPLPLVIDPVLELRARKNMGLYLVMLLNRGFRMLYRAVKLRGPLGELATLSGDLRAKVDTARAVRREELSADEHTRVPLADRIPMGPRMVA